MSIDRPNKVLCMLQTRPEKKHLAQFGLDLIKGEVRNNVQAGVLEPVLAKTKIIQVITALPAFWQGRLLIHSCTVCCVIRSQNSRYGLT